MVKCPVCQELNEWTLLYPDEPRGAVIFAACIQEKHII